MHVFHAAWIVPICRAPIRDGWVAFDRGRIVALGEADAEAEAAIAASDGGTPVEVDLGSAAVLPGLVNAHTHLELSWMRGAVPNDGLFLNWIKAVLDLRRTGPPGGQSTRQLALSRAIEECFDCGTVLVGDVTNTMMTVEPLAASWLYAVVFRELIGFRGDDAQALMDQAADQVTRAPRTSNLRVTLAAHAPYSVSPRLFRAIAVAVSRDPFGRSSVHLGESLEEMAFLQHGGGPWRSLLEELSVWDQEWKPPACDPVEYLDRMGFLNDRLLCVHGVHLDEQGLRCLAGRGATLVTCPRSNRLTGAGLPPVHAFYSAGLRVAVGTDSLGSVPDLNLFSELAELRRLAPDVPAAALLESATRQGAKALGWEADFGTIEPGKRARLISVALPGEVADVEQYLVEGIDREQITWVG